MTTAILAFAPISQDKMKPQYLEQLPGQLKQFSLFLGKYSWFAGEKVGEEKGRLYLSISTGIIYEHLRPDHHIVLFLAHLCGFPHL